MLLDILTVRSYARAKEALDRAKDNNEVAGTPMIGDVWDVIADILKDKRRQHKESDGDTG